MSKPVTFSSLFRNFFIALPRASPLPRPSPRFPLFSKGSQYSTKRREPLDVQRVLVRGKHRAHGGQQERVPRFDGGRNVLQRVGSAAGRVRLRAAGLHTHGLVGLRYTPAPHLTVRCKQSRLNVASIPRPRRLMSARRYLQAAAQRR